MATERVSRADRYSQVKALRDEGLLLREIAGRTGLAVQTVHDVLNDPTGEKARERKRRLYGRPCDECGAPLSIAGCKEAQGRSGRCARCEREWRGSPEGRRLQSAACAGRLLWSDEAILCAVRNVARGGRVTTNMYAAEYARAPKDAMPSLALVIRRFETWAQAVTAAGLEPTRSYGPRVDRWAVGACRDALVVCAAELRKAPTADEYEAWAAGREDAPSLTTMRARLGNWVEASLAAFAYELAEVA